SAGRSRPADEPMSTQLANRNRKVRLFRACGEQFALLAARRNAFSNLFTAGPDLAQKITVAIRMKNDFALTEFNPLLEDVNRSGHNHCGLLPVKRLDEDDPGTGFLKLISTGRHFLVCYHKVERHFGTDCFGKAGGTRQGRNDR